MKFTPKPISTKLHRGNNDKIYQKTIKSPYLEEEKKSELFEPSDTVKKERKKKNAFLNYPPKSKPNTSSAMKTKKSKKLETLKIRKIKISSQIY